MSASEILILAIRASIFLTVLGIGLSATRDDATFLLRERGLLVRSLLAMFVVMPLVATLVAVAFDLPFTVKVALIALAIAPVPPILPRKEVKAGARAAYAVALLVVSALIAIVYVPLALDLFDWVFGREGRVSPVDIAKIMVMTVLVPVTVGMAVRHWRPALADKIAGPVLLIGSILLVAGTLPLLIAVWPAVSALFGNGTVLIIALVVLAGLAIGHVLGGPVADDRTVLALSTATRHPAVALAVASAGGGGTKPALAAVLLYVVVALLVSVPYVQWRRRRHAASGSPA